MSISGVLVSVWRRKGTVLAAVLASLAAAVCALHFEPRMYEAQAVLDPDDANASGAFDDALLESVAKRLNVTNGFTWWDRLFAASPVSALKRNLRIEQDGPRALRIRFESSDPQMAARFANALAENYVEQNAETRRRAADDSARALRARASQVEVQLQQDRAALRGAYPTSSELLKDRVEANRRIYESMLEQINQATIAPPSGVRVIATAQAPLEPSRPDAATQLSFAILFGIVLGAGGAMLREKTDTKVRGPEVVSGVPVLASIPRAPRTERGALDPPAIERAAWEEKDSETSEAFRSVLASIFSFPSGRGIRAMLVTSPRAAEGKTTVASNLAIALAQIQRRVLLIDADLRRPRLHAIFDVANTSGLGDLLCANPSVLDLPPGQLVKSTDIPNLSLLSSGPGTDGIFNRLYSSRMTRLLTRFREEFDHVVIDAPPALEVADARMLARGADGVILVLRANRSDKRDAAAVIEQLRYDGARIPGIVLNEWRASRRDYRYRRPYGYGAGGADKAQDEELVRLSESA
jgi:polysaccharide biosynthesis transport protein